MGSNGSVMQEMFYEQTPDHATVDEEPTTTGLMCSMMQIQAKHGAILENIAKTLELILSKLSFGISPATSLTLNDESIACFEKIGSIEQLNDFEEKLKNSNFVQTLASIRLINIKMVTDLFIYIILFILSK